MGEGTQRGPSRPPGLARNSLVGRVAALAAGNDHPAWLAMSDVQRQEYYRRAEKIISAVADHLLVTAGRRTTGELVSED
jgi:hypothetical protein